MDIKKRINNQSFIQLAKVKGNFCGFAYFGHCVIVLGMKYKKQFVIQIRGFFYKDDFFLWSFVDIQTYKCSSLFTRNIQTKYICNDPTLFKHVLDSHYWMTLINGRK